MSAAEKNSHPLDFLEGSISSAVVQLYFQFNHMKQLYRQGWIRCGVPPEKCESLADHSFGVALLTMFLGDRYFPGLDSAKAVKMALVHDIGESRIGDITPVEGVSEEEKYRMELDSLNRILEGWEGKDGYVSLWKEFEEGETREAAFVRQMDRLDMVFQAGIYELQGLADLSEFFQHPQRMFRHPRLLEIFREIEKLRSGQ